jgi:predicted lipoprotein
LHAAWRNEPGSFREQFVAAGTGSTVYSDVQQALNAVNEGLFYLDTQLKDAKLGVPLGLNETACATRPCPDAVESRYAAASVAHLRANLRGFRALFEGCRGGGAGVGFDDWLRAKGNADLAERMLAALANADAALAAIELALEQALVANIDQVQAAYDAVKGVTDLLKTEFVTALNLELPSGAETDND